MIKKLFLPAWIISVIILFLYSFTQIDLSLTFSRASIWQTVQRDIFQYIGYFNRPLSTYLYVGILIVFFILYVWSLLLAYKKKLSKKTLWTAVIIITILLGFSYNAFSYDLFNYIFDAKMITHYQQNPYIHKALDFPGDPMLSFMHWTHRVYPYGPVWLGLTVPLSFIGLGYFIVTFYLFKFLMAGAYIGTGYYIYKIAEKVDKDISDEKKKINPLFALGFFALNPLVIIESLISAHNDIVMMFFAIFGIYLFLQKKIIFSIGLLAISLGIKFATIFLIPPYLFLFFSKDKKMNTFFLLCLISMIIPFVLVTLRTTYQPWYLLYLIPFAAFLSRKYYVLIPILILSIFSLIQYIPYLYLGNWDPPVPQILYWMSVSGIVISMGVCLSIFIKKEIS